MDYIFTNGAFTVHSSENPLRSAVPKRLASFGYACGLCLLSVCAAAACAWCAWYSTVGNGIDSYVHVVHVCVRARTHECVVAMVCMRGLQLFHICLNH